MQLGTVRFLGTLLARLTEVPEIVASANLALVLLAGRLLGDAEDVQLGAAVFFAFLITLIVGLYDAYRPVHDIRFADPPLQIAHERT